MAITAEVPLCPMAFKCKKRGNKGIRVLTVSASVSYPLSHKQEPATGRLAIEDQASSFWARKERYTNGASVFASNPITKVESLRCRRAMASGFAKGNLVWGQGPPDRAAYNHSQHSDRHNYPRQLWRKRHPGSRQIDNQLYTEKEVKQRSPKENETGIMARVKGGLTAGALYALKMSSESCGNYPAPGKSRRSPD